MRIAGVLLAAFCVVRGVPASAETPQTCPAEALGVARVVDIDASGGPWFGAPFGDRELLGPGEVVLTFDDGPMPRSTRPILAALAAQCTRATFFMVGEMAAAHADVVRRRSALRDGAAVRRGDERRPTDRRGKRRRGAV